MVRLEGNKEKNLFLNGVVDNVLILEMWMNGEWFNKVLLGNIVSDCDGYLYLVVLCVNYVNFLKFKWMIGWNWIFFLFFV